MLGVYSYPMEEEHNKIESVMLQMKFTEKPKRINRSTKALWIQLSGWIGPACGLIAVNILDWPMMLLIVAVVATVVLWQTQRFITMYEVSEDTLTCINKYGRTQYNRDEVSNAYLKGNALILFTYKADSQQGLFSKLKKLQLNGVGDEDQEYILAFFWPRK